MASASDNLEVQQRLAGVDWNFVDATTPDLSVHAIHWFPGNFIPQIPSYLIQALSAPDALVLDPFCGSGTTAIEALRLGRRARQGDACRASIQVAKAKVLAAFRPDLAVSARQLGTELTWDDLYRSSLVGDAGEGGSSELSRWYHVGTLEQLRYLWKLIERTEPDFRSLLEVIFTDVLFAAASPGAARTKTGGIRRHHWGWIADNVTPRRLVQHNAIDLFRRRLARLEQVLMLSERRAIDCTTVREDARRLSAADGSVDLIVTSPPYLGMIDYVLANRLTYLWMGWDLDSDREVELGSRRRRNSASGLLSYTAAIRECANEFSRALRVGGYCAIVIGSSRKTPQVALDICSIFSSKLELVFGPQSRTPTRRRVSERGGTSPVEWICVLRKVN